MTKDRLVRVVSHSSVDQTLRRLEAAFSAKGLQVFAVIDHRSEAEKVGLKMRPTKLGVFGSQKSGTALKEATPSLAIELASKALAAEDADDEVWVTYNPPRHGVPQELIKNLAGAGALVEKAVE